MNHNKTALAIASIVVAVALAGVAFTTPQQVLAGGHHNHKHNSVKVDQQINQLNNCTSPLPPPPKPELTAGTPGSTSSTVCLNFGDNSADIHK
jgi:hypothetical protein